jgi:transcriptional regulator with XRE-family HTH domain
MTDVRLGIRFRALRHRLGWRQEDLAKRCGLTQDFISLVERGKLDSLQLRKLRQVAAELDADLPLLLRWRGGDLDRLVDEGHANLVGSTTDILKAAGWQIRPEVSYAIYGERGSIDLLAWHQAARVVLVVEVKTELVSVEETLRKHDEKSRLARQIAAEEVGWEATTVARLLILPDQTTSRRRVGRHSSVIDAAYPLRGKELRRWLSKPGGAMAGLLFVAPLKRRDHETKRAIGRKRVRSANTVI